MSEPMDWLEQTWEIKRKIAEKYAGVAMSEQIRDMRERVMEEWKRRGWAWTEKPTRPGRGTAVPSPEHSLVKPS